MWFLFWFTVERLKGNGSCDHEQREKILELWRPPLRKHSYSSENCGGGLGSLQIRVGRGVGNVSGPRVSSSPACSQQPQSPDPVWCGRHCSPRTAALCRSPGCSPPGSAPPRPRWCCPIGKQEFVCQRAATAHSTRVKRIRPLLNACDSNRAWITAE